MLAKLVLVGVFSFVVAIFLKPKGKYTDLHILLLGLAVILVSAFSSMVFGYNAKEVMLLSSSSGPERGVIAGYAIVIGVVLRGVLKIISR